MRSFVIKGHEFHLWLYDELQTPIPAGVIVEDASSVIPRDKAFYYKNINQFGHGKKSYAGFSDIFRYKLLFEKGGWWADMDVFCLKAFDFKEPYVFRSHHDLPVVGNMIKCPPASELMKRCYEQAINEVDENNTDWNKPIRILNDNIEQLGLSLYIQKISNDDKWNDVRKLLYKNEKIPDSWHAIHLVNEEWRRNNINKNFFFKGSAIARLYETCFEKKQDIIIDIPLTERIKLSYMGAAFIQVASRLKGCYYRMVKGVK